MSVKQVMPSGDKRRNAERSSHEIETGGDGGGPGMVRKNGNNGDGDVFGEGAQNE